MCQWLPAGLRCAFPGVLASQAKECGYCQPREQVAVSAGHVGPRLSLRCEDHLIENLAYIRSAMNAQYRHSLL